MPKSTILVVEDEPHIVELVRDYLQEAGYTVIVAGNGPLALALIRREKPALVVLDLMLPGGMDGLDVCRAIRRDRETAQVPVVMLTARVELADRLVGLALGADDYITKPFSPREVVARVKAVLRRVEGHVADLDVIEVANLAIDRVRRTVTVDGAPVELTPTEFDLLVTLAAEPGRVFTRAQLVAAIYDVAYEGYDRAVDTHIKNLRRKIEPNSREPRTILTVYGVGYRLAEV